MKPISDFYFLFFFSCLFLCIQRDIPRPTSFTSRFLLDRPPCYPFFITSLHQSPDNLPLLLLIPLQIPSQDVHEWRVYIVLHFILSASSSASAWSVLYRNGIISADRDAMFQRLGKSNPNHQTTKPTNILYWKRQQRAGRKATLNPSYQTNSAIIKRHANRIPNPNFLLVFSFYSIFLNPLLLFLYYLS